MWRWCVRACADAGYHRPGRFAVGKIAVGVLAVIVAVLGLSGVPAASAASAAGPASPASSVTAGRHPSAAKPSAAKQAVGKQAVGKPWRLPKQAAGHSGLAALGNGPGAGNGGASTALAA